MKYSTKLTRTEYCSKNDLDYYTGDDYYGGCESYGSELDAVIDPAVYTSNSKWSGELEFDDDQWPWGC